jgi:hypothetical protein
MVEATLLDLETEGVTTGRSTLGGGINPPRLTLPPTATVVGE